MSETITTITIKTNSGNVTDVQSTAIPVEDKAVAIKSAKKKRCRDNYAVRDLNLLSKIISAGLIGFLHGIQIKSDKIKSSHFDKAPEVKAIIDTYSILTNISRITAMFKPVFKKTQFDCS